MDTGQLQAIAYSSRVDRSFSFLDLCGFTDFADSEGDEAAVEEARCLRQVVREVAPLFGVRVEKWLGDGVMMVGVEIERLVGAVVADRTARRCCLPVAASGRDRERFRAAGGRRRLHRSRRQHCGPLCATPPATARCLPRPTALDVPDWVEASDPAELRLRGLAEPVNVVELTSALNLPTVLDGPDRAGWSIATLLEGITRPVRSKRGA